MRGIKSTKKLYNKLRLGLTASFPGNYVPQVVLCIVKDFFKNSMSINMYGWILLQSLANVEALSTGFYVIQTLEEEVRAVKECRECSCFMHGYSFRKEGSW